MTAISTLTQNWDSYTIAIMAERAPTLAKQTIDDNPLLEAATQREISSAMGLRIERPLEIGRNPNAGYLQSFDAMVEIVPTEVAAMAVYKPSLLACPIRFNAGEKKINDSNKYADVIDLRMNQARRTLAEILNQALYGVGANLKTIGLGAYIPTTVGSNTVGTINEANAPFWRSQVRTGAGSFAANGHNGTANDYMLDMWITCSSSGNGTKGAPSKLIADPLFYQYYSASEGQRTRILKGDDFGELYKGAMTYRGVPILFDKVADPNTVWYSHDDAFSWYAAPGFNMDVSAMRPVGNQPYVDYCVITLFHQWVCDRRNQLGKITGWSR